MDFFLKFKSKLILLLASSQNRADHLNLVMTFIVRSQFILNFFLFLMYNPRGLKPENLEHLLETFVSENCYIANLFSLLHFDSAKKVALFFSTLITSLCLIFQPFLLSYLIISKSLEVERGTESSLQLISFRLLVF